MAVTRHDFQDDIDDISQIPIITNLLNVVCSTTGMGFSAIARVTDERWVTCGVHDSIDFGLKPGDELDLKTTICNEIRVANNAVVIDSVKNDPFYCNHHTPALYGFQSYISVPIIRKDGSFFGTLCAIDPSPRNVSSPAVLEMFNLFTDLIAFHLDSLNTLRSNEKTLLEDRAFIATLEKKVDERTSELQHSNDTLEKMNKELQSFAYISSHDLQEPLRKIQTFAMVIIEQESKNLSDKGKDYFLRMQSAAARMQTLINDLLAYSRTSNVINKFEVTDLNEVIGEVLADLQEEITEKEATIRIPAMCHAEVIPSQFRQLLYNLVSNSLKFSAPERPPVVTIKSIEGYGINFNHKQLKDDKLYCHISVTDNGIGFDQQYDERIFQLFQRLQDRSVYKGTGIGLAIVKKIVDNHNGFIDAEGTLGKGSSFNIYIPVELRSSGEE
jgi:signal transduction histidine kinase